MKKIINLICAGLAFVFLALGGVGIILPVLAVITCLFTIGFILTPVWYAKGIILLVVVFHYYYFLFRIKAVKVREG